LRASDVWQQAFAAALAQHPWLLGWQTAASEALHTARLAQQGTIPAGLYGTFYRNGPARHELGGERYQHWFDGDGMVQAFQFAPHGITHHGRFVRTTKYTQETQAGKLLQQAFGTVPVASTPPVSSGALNSANISVLVHAKKLLALWEGGDAYRLEPHTLETLGTQTWRPDLIGLPFSAHPKVEPDGTLWNFGLSVAQGVLVLYHIAPHGALVTTGTVKIAHAGMLHDFVVTARHLVFALHPLVYERALAEAGAAFLDAHVWRPALGSRVLTVEKADFSKTRWYELPAHFHFHFGNAWEAPDGTLHFDYCRAADPSLMTQTLRYVMRGEARPGASAQTTLVRLDPASGRVHTDSFPEVAEFPRVDPRVVGQPHRYLYSVIAPAAPLAPYFGFSAVARRDLHTGALDRFDYGPQTLVEEHLVVPRPGSATEGDGWLVGTVLDIKAQVTRVCVFDALHLADGPLVTATLPYALPLGLHGTFAGS
jgi:carotenoid cleavage dioxygenase